MERITVKCPECGHRMDIDPKVIAFRCSQCGKKIDLDDEPIKDEPLKWPDFNKYNTSHTNRTVDDAEVIKARMEYEEKQRVNENWRKFDEHPFKEFAKLFAPFIVFAFGLIGIYLLFNLFIRFVFQH